jgi:hypothetical protein
MTTENAAIKKNSGAANPTPITVDDPNTVSDLVADQKHTEGAEAQSSGTAPAGGSQLGQIEIADVFGDLSQFQDTAASAVEAVKRTLTRVPLVRAQGGGQRAGSFVCIHPTFELIGVGLVNDPRDVGKGESYLVKGKPMVTLLAKWVVPVDLHVAITREGFDQGHWPVHLWPVPANPYDKSGKLNAYLQTHRLIAQNAKARWLRMIGSNQQYEEEAPENPKKLPAIDWAEMPWTFKDILAKAFPPSSHVITDDQHPLVSHLFGR